jgi:hypothetical protein
LEPQDGIETYRLFLFLEPYRVLAVKEKDMIYFKFGESLGRIGTVKYKSPIYARKLITQILKDDYGLGNLILKFPEELIDQRVFRYESLDHISEEARCCVEICNMRVRIREEPKSFIYDEEICENLQGIWFKIYEAREGNRKDDV